MTNCSSGDPSNRRRPRSKVGMGLLAVTLLLAGMGAVFVFWGDRSQTNGNHAAASEDDHGENSSPDGRDSRPANRLARETSPYLLQHAHNPVDWYPWCPEAFQRAKQEGKLIFLSVGYSTCYWCHVMERESFENDEIAEILNEHYIAIKVDREERPDIDQQYMLASQLLAGRGGWPNSVWLLPDGRPWMAGTYFPRERFGDLLLDMVKIWKTRRNEVEQQAQRVTAAVREAGLAKASAAKQRPLDQPLVDRAVLQVRQSFDAQHGGFGGAPKFPPHDKLLLLAHEYRRSGDAVLLEMLTATLDAMAAGGIHDHLGGGFHRYSTDEAWLLPHFEKMLYDNAQLLRAYTEGYVLTKDEAYREIALGIVAWIEREMTAAGGAFYSGIDAESEQEEGKFYVWPYDEVLATLGQQQGNLFAAAYGLDQQGNYVEQTTGKRAGTNVVYLPEPLAQLARGRDLDPARLKSDLDAMREKLLAVRAERIPPRTDDKILSGWNGLMIGSLAYAGQQLKEPQLTTAATNAAQFVLAKMTEDGRLLRTYRAGQAKIPAYLNDYAFLANGLLDLYEATNDRQWLDAATQLTDTMLDSFHDKEDGGFFFTSSGHEDLLMRSKNLLGGGNIPSGNAVAAEVLLRFGRISQREDYHQTAEQTLEAFSDLMWRQPLATDSLILATAISLQTD